MKRASEHGLGDLLERFHVVEPIGYRAFLALEAEAALIVSDSGGVQEEASIVKTPVVVVRNSTERPEVIGTFADRVAPDALAETANLLKNWDCHNIDTPYGDGSASRRSLEALAERLA